MRQPKKQPKTSENLQQDKTDVAATFTESSQTYADNPAFFLEIKISFANVTKRPWAKEEGYVYPVHSYCWNPIHGNSVRLVDKQL